MSCNSDGSADVSMAMLPATTHSLSLRTMIGIYLPGQSHDLPTIFLGFPIWGFH